jgi:hypothetical protein
LEGTDAFIKGLADIAGADDAKRRRGSNVRFKPIRMNELQSGMT